MSDVVKHPIALAFGGIAFAFLVGEAVMRQRRRAPAGSADKPPIVAVGDSMTFGDEVDDGDTWPAKLEQRSGRRVINAGVFGWLAAQLVKIL